MRNPLRVLNRNIIHYLIAIGFVAAATLFRVLTQPLLGLQLINITYLTAVMFTAWLGGFRPALLALGLGIGGVVWFRQQDGEALLTPDTVIGLLGLTISGLLSVALSHMQHVAEQKAMTNAEQLEVALRQVEQESQERRRAEEALRLSMTQLQDMVGSIGDVLYTLNRDWRFTFVNREAEKLWNRSAASLIGKSIWDEFPMGINTPAYGQMQHSMAEGVPVRFETWSAFLQRWEEVCVYPFDGGLTVYFHDITERKEAENKVLLTGERFRTALEAAKTVVVFNQDRDLRYTWIYNSKLVSAEAVVGKTDLDLLPNDEDARTVLKLKQQVLASGTAVQQEVCVWTGDVPQYFDMVIAPLRDNTGEIIGITCASIDVTERKARELEFLRALESEKEAHAKAEQSNRLLVQFTGMVAHELRAPVASIKGFSNTLLSNDVAWSPEQHREFVEIIDQQASQMGRRVDDLLDVSRSQSGALRLNVDSYTFDDAMQLARHQIEVLAADHQLTVDVPPDLPTLKIDPQRTSQVLVNLINNAVKYTPPQGQIILCGMVRDDMLEVTISDQGPGIPADMRDLLFQPFQQVQPAGVQQQGTGLGLAICRALIEAQGGRIWLAESASKGTTIAFTLPIDTSIG